MVNECLLAHAEIMEHRNFNKYTLLNFFSSIPNSYYSIVICGDGSLPGASPLFFPGSWKGGQSFFLSLLGLDCFQFKIIYIQNGLSWSNFVLGPYNSIIPIRSLTMYLLSSFRHWWERKKGKDWNCKASAHFTLQVVRSGVNTHSC